jgi:hypothetical protein
MKNRVNSVIKGSVSTPVASGMFKISNTNLQRSVKTAPLRQDFQNETIRDNSNKRPRGKEVFIDAEEKGFCGRLMDWNRIGFGCCTTYQICL